jgi:serine/threonine protein kinase
MSCPNGHQWESPGEEDTQAEERSIACPACGATGIRLETLDAEAWPELGGELPPLPRPVVPPGVGVPAEPTAPVAPPPAAAWPRLVGFEILGELGRGGMGIVYRARQQSLGRVVAVKMLRPDSGAGPEELARFRREAEAVAVLRHSNFVHIYDIGAQDGRPFFVLEYVEGGSLARRLAGQPLPPRQAAELLETLARAIHCAHQRGIVHRDLKPANVLLMADGTPKIADFGLVKKLDATVDQTRTGAVMGTPSYMAPEQALGRTRDIGPATDIYALGAILYELLTGRPPFQGATVLYTLSQVVHEPPVPPSRLQPQVPPDLETICLRCLQKEPAQRYATAEGLAQDLCRFLASEPLVGRTVLSPLPAQRGNCRSRRRWIGVGSGAFVGLLGIGLGWGLWWNSGERNGPAQKQPPVVPSDGTKQQNPDDRQGPPPPGMAEPSWQLLAVGSRSKDEVFERIAFPSRSIGYVASRTAVHKTEDGGKTWQRIHEFSSGRVHLLQFEDERTGWLGTSQLQQTSDGGQTWKVVDLPETMRAVNGLAVGPDGWMLAGGTSSAGQFVLFSRQKGHIPWQTASRFGPPVDKWFLGGLAILGPREAMVAMYQGYDNKGQLVHTLDGGKSWTVPFAAEEDLYHLHFADAKRGWLAGFHGTLRHTQDGGKSWQVQPKLRAVTAGCLAFAPRGSSFGLAPLWKGEVLWTTTGETWEAIAVGLGYAMPGAAVVDPGWAYVLGAEGDIAHYVDPRVPPTQGVVAGKK